MSSHYHLRSIPTVPLIGLEVLQLAHEMQVVEEKDGQFGKNDEAWRLTNKDVGIKFIDSYNL